MDQYWESIRTKVCRKCIDGNGKGACRLPADEACALQVFLPELVSIITRLELDSYDAYVQALRAHICARCQHLLIDGTCRKRETLECALDRYYPLIIDVIESVKNRQGSFSETGSPFQTA